MITSIFIVLIYLILFMLMIWLIAIKIKNPTIIDVAWAIGLTTSGLLYLFTPPINTRLIIISALLTIWGCRLASYLFFARISKGIIDKRYETISANWTKFKWIGFLLNFQLQGLFIFGISSVFIFIAKADHSTFHILDGLGTLLCIIGIMGETIADIQLNQFKKNHSKQVCNIGLWNYTRHPNLFFDWLTWCGFACFGLSAHLGYLSLISPLLLFIIMNYITGPITERGSLASRGDRYLAYQKSTPYFFPRFKKSMKRPSV